MSKKLFVGNLDWGTDSTALREGFSQYGKVLDACVIEDRYNGRSRGFGFVTFETADGAHEAIEELDGAMFDGRQIHVEVAKERRPRREPTHSERSSAHASVRSEAGSSAPRRDAAGSDGTNWRGGHRGW